MRVSRLSKTYAGTPALRDVELELAAGEVHALVGGNGSGKSTLIKILAGVVHADHGCVLEIDGLPRTSLQHWTPERAQAAGLRFVHQQPASFPELTVAENLAIGGRFPTRLGRIRWGELHARTAELLRRHRLPVSPTAPLGSLRPAERGRVEIIRALQDEARVLVLDEPTAALPDQEARDLLVALRDLAAAGHTILFVSHRLGEVLGVADRVSVLRDGRLVETVPAAGLTESRLVEMIVGRPLERMFPDRPGAAGGPEVLRLTGVRGGPLHGVDLSLRAGEVLGIGGLLGSGRSELLRMVFGAEPVASGRMLLDGRPVRFRSPAEAMAAGFALVPEDRQLEGAFAGEPVRHNLSAGRAGAFFRYGVFRHGREAAAARALMAGFLVRAASDRLPIEALSGGNQQKVILARWLARRPRVLLLDEPTQGVDVGARGEIYALVRKATRAGTAVLLVASDPEELAHACDRVAILRGGRVTAVESAPLDVHRLTDLMNFSEASR